MQVDRLERCRLCGVVLDNDRPPLIVRTVRCGDLCLMCHEYRFTSWKRGAESGGAR